MIIEAKGLSGLTQELKSLFDYTIMGLEREKVLAEKAAWSVFGKPLEDMMSLLRLQHLIVNKCQSVAKFIVPFHYQQAVDVLNQLKPIKNAKL